MEPPFKPFLLLRAGGREYTTESGVVSVQIEMKTNMVFGTKATIDVNMIDTELERMYMETVPLEVEILYGWMDSRGKTKSGVFRGNVVKAISSGEKVPRLTLEALGMGSINLYKEDRQVRRKGRVEDVVRQIASESGLEADVDSTGMEIDMLQLNMSGYDFIAKKILPYVNARTTDDRFSFWVSNGVVFFKRVSHSSVKFVYGLHLEDDFSAILSLESEMNLVPGLLSGEEVEVVKLDPNTKSVSLEKASNDTLAKRVVLGTKKARVGSRRKRVAVHGDLYESAVGVARNLYGAVADYPMRISFTALGRLDLQPMQTVEVIAYAFTRNGYEVRPLSGKYLIMNIVQTVSAEGFLTSITALKNAGGVGQEEAKGVKVS